VAEIAVRGEVRIFMNCRFGCERAFDKKGVNLLAKANRLHHNKPHQDSLLFVKTLSLKLCRSLVDLSRHRDIADAEIRTFLPPDFINQRV
jgi:hypothetical protein